MKDIQNATPGGYRDSPQPAAANPKRVALWHQIASADRVLDRVTSAHQIHLSRRLTGSSSSTITTIAYTLYSLWLCPIHCTFRCIRHPSPITGDLARHIISPSLSCFKCFEALSGPVNSIPIYRSAGPSDTTSPATQLFSLCPAYRITSTHL